MRFTCCLNMAFTWNSLNWALICMHCVTLESVAAVTEHFADAFVRENVARVYMTFLRRNDVRKFDTDAILFREIKCKKMDIFKMFKRRFQRGLCWNQVKYARITITHVCFIALTLAGSLGRCLNTRPNGLVFKQLPRDRQMLMHEKTCVIPILFHKNAYRTLLTGKNPCIYQAIHVLLMHGFCSLHIRILGRYKKYVLRRCCYLYELFPV